VTTSDNVSANGDIAVTCTASDGQQVTIYGDGTISFVLPVGSYTSDCAATDVTGNTGYSDTASVDVTAP